MCVREVNLRAIERIAKDVTKELNKGGGELSIDIYASAMISLQGNGVSILGDKEFHSPGGLLNINSEKIEEYIRMQKEGNKTAPKVLVLKPNIILGAIIGGLASVLGTNSSTLQVVTIVGLVLTVQGALAESFSRLTDNEAWVCYAIWSCLRDSEDVEADQLFEYLKVSMKSANCPVLLKSELDSLLSILKEKKIITITPTADQIRFLELQIVSA